MTTEILVKVIVQLNIVNEMTLKGLIFYLKVPADLHGQ